MALPALRALDIFPAQTRHGLRFHIRDHERVQENELTVHPLVALIALCLDGRRDIPEVQKWVEERTGGARIAEEQIRRLVDELDAHYLLQTPRFEERRRKLVEEYRRHPVRPMTLFPAEIRDRLAEMLDGFFTQEGGPGARPSGRGPAVRGIISPHIDYFRGGPAYAHAYKALVEGTTADLFVVLGVAHVSPPSPFVISDKSYETPFGELRCDTAFIERLRSRLDWDPSEHIFAERSEHSIELQAIFLRHLLGPSARIVPILCCSFEPWGTKPSEVDRIEGTIRALGETIEEEQGKVCLISGADLSHIGPRFGDPFDLTDEVLEWMEKEDRASLKLAEQGDAEAFYADVVRDGNPRKVCGLSSIYTFLRLVKGPGRLLYYGHAHDPAGGEVSFASLAF